MLPGTRQQKQWFFQIVTPSVRFNTYNLPNQQTYENLVSSAAFILNSEDSADTGQAQQGLVLKSLAADILSAIDVKDIGFGNLALSVSPMQLPTVVLTGGSVSVTQNGTTGALIYTLPEYLLSSDGDVTLTSPSNGQVLMYNGTKWVNSNIYTQTIDSNLTPVTQRPVLNFSTTFGITDDAIHACTTITIAPNSITYSLIQHTSGGTVLLGNSTGSSGAVSEQTIGSGLTLSSGSLSITVNGIAYSMIQKSVNAFSLLSNPTNATNNYQEIGLSSALSFTSSTGAFSWLLDIAVNGITYGNIQQTSNGQVLLGNSTNAAGNVSEITVSGMQLTGGVLSSAGLKKVTGNTYTVVLTDFNGLILGFTFSSTGTVSVAMCNPALVPQGVSLNLKDLSGAAATHNITINPFSGETFDGSATLVISSNYGKTKIFSDGTNWYTI